MLERPILRGSVNFPLMLAPMVGLSHVAFRSVLRAYLPAAARTIWPTEMLNSRRLPNEIFTRVPEILRAADETDLVPQILGNEETAIRKSVARLECEWRASGIDINMGCPVKKALAHNYGVSLMGDPEYAADVVRMTVNATTLPVSVKLRASPPGTDGGSSLDFLLRFAGGLVDAGAEWLTLHPRTAAQKRRGRADWSQIRELRKSVPVAVIGNGDIQVADDVLRMLDETGCDAVMAGRALTARPWLLWQVGESLGFAAPEGRDGERAPRTAEEEGIEFARAWRCILVALKHFHPDHIAGANWNESLLVRKARFYLKNAAPWLQFGHELEARLSRAESIAQALEISDRFFTAHPQTMSSRSELRF